MAVELEQVRQLFFALSNLTDVSFTAETADDFLKFNGTNWSNYSLFSGSQTWTGVNTVNDTGRFVFLKNTLVVALSDGGGRQINLNTHTNQATEATVTFPVIASADTIGMLGLTQTWTGNNTFSGSTSINDLLMTDNIQMGNNNISGLNNLTFTDVNGQIAGIANQNLLDKTADETITGDWTLNAGTSTTYPLTLGGTSTAGTLKWLSFVDGVTQQGEVGLTLGFFGFTGIVSAFFGVNTSNFILTSTAGVMTISASTLIAHTGASTFSSTVGITGKLTASAEVEIDGALNHDGTTVGFYGTAPVVVAGAMTAQDTSITHTAPGTPDFALQDLVDSGVGSAFGFATKDEGNTVLQVVLNLQTRVQELEDALDSTNGVGIIT